MQEFQGGPGTSLERTRSAVNAPALALMIVAGLGALFALYTMFAGNSQVFDALKPLVANNPQALEQLEQAQSRSGGIQWRGLINVAIAGFVLFGALQMRQVKSYGLAMAASIVALVPCLGPCCCLGIPFGIWSLVVLAKPEVKAGFADAERGGRAS